MSKYNEIVAGAGYNEIIACTYLAIGGFNV